MVEGIILAGYATGASNGYIFIRHGHDGPIDRARSAMQQAYDLGLLGTNILGSDYSFELEVGAQNLVPPDATRWIEARKFRYDRLLLTG